MSHPVLILQIRIPPTPSSKSSHPSPNANPSTKTKTDSPSSNINFTTPSVKVKECLLSIPSTNQAQISANNSKEAPPSTLLPPSSARESCLNCSLQSFRCSFASQTTTRSPNTGTGCTRCSTNQDLCVHRTKNTSVSNAEKPSTYTYHVSSSPSMPSTSSDILTAKVNELLASQKSRNRFTILLPVLGYGRERLRGLEERFVREREERRIEEEEKVERLRKVVEGLKQVEREEEEVMEESDGKRSRLMDEF
ncbi:hypothetical protein VTL71DRAFT_16209 [Oculimacula yallundae]|uniref:Zn(2)-C6 fungal-type domain-containing protein n=1 Tax=Oculimacula yallundae TaxID=86028 RepID=A0ABR4CDT4_9HELO